MAVYTHVDPDDLAGLVARYDTSINNALQLDWAGGSNNPRLRSIVGGATVTTIVGTGGAWTSGDVIEMTLAGSACSCSTAPGAAAIRRWGRWSRPWSNSKRP